MNTTRQFLYVYDGNPLYHEDAVKEALKDELYSDDVPPDIVERTLADQDKILTLCYEACKNYLEDEIENLNMELPGKIVVLGKLGLWHGSVYGYKVLGNNLSDILTMDYAGDEPSIYGDGENICAEDPHHDGVNFYTFRMLKPEIEEDEIYEFLQEYICGGPDDELIDMFTVSLWSEVAKVYGW